MKDKIIKLFKDNPDSYLSGEALSKSLGISRAAIWKYINTLKEDGYEFDSSTKIGYKLIYCPDIVTYSEIDEFLKTKYIGRTYLHHHTITSTNDKSKELAKQNPINGCVVISEEQSSGRGRLGRNWTSPKSKGLWFSITLTPNIPPSDASKITLIGAAAVYLALKDLGLETLIKWPNDIILNSKKVSGILTEMSGELNAVNYIIMGIGVNANIDLYDFPSDILQTATSLKVETGSIINRKKLLAAILNNFEILYDDFINNNNFKTTLNISREASILIGKDVQCINRGTVSYGKALDIDDNGELIVDFGENGGIKQIISGEVSIRGLLGYVPS